MTTWTARTSTWSLHAASVDRFGTSGIPSRCCYEVMNLRFVSGARSTISSVFLQLLLPLPMHVLMIYLTEAAVNGERCCAGRVTAQYANPLYSALRAFVSNWPDSKRVTTGCQWPVLSLKL